MSTTQSGARNGPQTVASGRTFLLDVIVNP
jgi:hypothetical protein